MVGGIYAREQIMEEKFQQKKLLKFRQIACSLRLFGLKIAHRLGYHDEKAQDYSNEFLTLYLEDASIETLLKKVDHQLHQAQVSISKQQLYDELDHCYQEAKRIIR